MDAELYHYHKGEDAEMREICRQLFMWLYICAATLWFCSVCLVFGAFWEGALDPFAFEPLAKRLGSAGGAQRFRW